MNPQAISERTAVLSYLNHDGVNAHRLSDRQRGRLRAIGYADELDAGIDPGHWRSPDRSGAYYRAVWAEILAMNGAGLLKNEKK